MLSNALMFAGMATVAAGAGMAMRSNTSAATPSQREMELTEALVVDAELGLASRTVAPGMLANGGKLIDLMVPGGEKDAVKASATKTIDITERQSCDIELLCNGGLSPLTGFLNEDAYNKVVEEMRLPSGEILGLPIVMDTNDDAVAVGDKILLKFQGTEMAVMTVESKWQPDKALECVKCYGVGTIEHPGVRMVAMERGKYYLGGKVEGLGVPTREFPCLPPSEVRASLPDNVDVVAFQCRNPVHRAHYELFTRALDAPNVGEGAVVLVHPTCGPTQEDDIPGVVRYKTYKVLIEETKDTTSGKRTRWAYLPYSMHMAGPREAIQHMIIRKNYGCTTSSSAGTWPEASPAWTGRTFTAPTMPRTWPRRCPRSSESRPFPPSTSSTLRRRGTSPPTLPPTRALASRSSPAPSSGRCSERERTSQSGLPSRAWSRSSGRTTEMAQLASPTLSKPACLSVCLCRQPFFQRKRHGRGMLHQCELG